MSFILFLNTGPIKLDHMPDPNYVKTLIYDTSKDNWYITTGGMYSTSKRWRRKSKKKIPKNLIAASLLLKD